MEKPCPVCGKESIKIDINLSKCSYCLHIFQTDLKSTCSYDKNYLMTYINHKTCDAMSAARAAIILQSIDLPIGSKVLDVGYANGAFLKSMERIGYDVYGMDLHGQDMGIREVTIDTPIVYDIVCFFDALEHFEDISMLYTIQTKNIIVSIPHTPDFFSIYPQKWKHYKPGEHLHYFSKNSLDLYIERWGNFKKISSGYPEDIVRGRLTLENNTYHNIYTAIYSR